MTYTKTIWMNANCTAAVMSVVLACMTPAWCQAPAESEKPAMDPSLFENWKASFEIGGRNHDLYGDKPGKFLETRDINRGVFVRGVDVRFESNDSPYLFFLKGTDIRELDEKIKGDFWRVGRFRTTVPEYTSPRVTGIKFARLINV